MARLQSSKRAINIILFSHRKNTAENFSRNIKRNHRECKESYIADHLCGKRMCAEHLAAEEHEQNLHERYRQHDQKKSFVFTDIRQKTDTARSGVERIEYPAKNEQREKRGHKSNEITFKAVSCTNGRKD